MASIQNCYMVHHMLNRRRFLTGTLVTLLVITLSLGLAGTVEAVLRNIKLSGSLVTGGDVTLFKLSPDGKYAVFIADARSNGIPELFSVPSIGGARIPLSPPLAAGSAVLGFAISPNSQAVVYWTGLTADEATHLYAVPINGSAPALLLATAPATYWLTDMTISPNNLRVVYLLNRIDGGTQQTLFSVLLTGGTPAQLTAAFCGIACTYTFKITPDGTEVVYNGIFSGAPSTLRRVSIAGGVEQILDEDTYSFDITPDGDFVVYRKSFNGLDMNLYSIPIGGGTKTKLNGDLIAGKSVLDFKIAPNSQTVVYRGDEVVDEFTEIFSAPVDGSTARVRLLLKAGMIANGDVIEYQVTPNSAGVIYRADQLSDERIDLGAVSMDGQTSYWLNGPMVAGGDVSAFAITPNSLGVVFIADMVADGTDELFVVSYGIPPVKLNADMPTDRDVLDFLITPNNLGVVYRADQESNEIYNLYLVPTVDGTPVRLNDPLPLLGDVSAQYAVTPNSKGVVYLADQDSDGVDELFATYDVRLSFLPVVTK